MSQHTSFRAAKHGVPYAGPFRSLGDVPFECTTQLVAVPVLARCQLHKIRHVRDKLPQRLRPIVGRRMCAAYHAEAALQAEGLLTQLARELDTTHPSASASLRGGLAKTLTVLRLGCRP